MFETDVLNPTKGSRPGLAVAGIISMAAAAFLFFSTRQLIPDIAWLLEGSRRWLDGQQLYRDIIEVNPPMAFYTAVALSGGILSGPAYIAGNCIALALSSLWVLRLRGPYAAFAALAAMLLGGLTDFGQRDHLALIFVIPFLFAGSARFPERVALGLWAFIGVGLKPHLLAIPIAAALARAVLDKSMRPLVAPELVSLGIASAAYLCLAFLLHPAYFADIVPLARFVYGAYGSPVKVELAGLSVVLVLVGGLALLLGERRTVPLAAAMLAGLASFYLQGRNWSYHFVPALGLGILLSILLARHHRAALPLAVVLCAGQLVRGPHQPMPSAPFSERSVAVLSAHVFAAYPRAVHNATRYPALWTLPGAWNALNDPGRSATDRERARRILEHERAIIRADILRDRPDAIYAHANRTKRYFRRPFDYMEFLGPLPGYRFVGRRENEGYVYDVYRRE